MTNTHHNLQEIVDEIIALAPELESKRDEIVKLVEKLIETKPDVVVDEAFVSDLRARLQSSIRAKEAMQPVPVTFTEKMKHIFTTKKAMSVLVLILAVIVVYPALDLSGTKGGQELSLAPQVHDVRSQAFGNFSEKELTEADVTSVEQEFAMDQTSANTEEMSLMQAPPGAGGGATAGSGVTDAEIATNPMIWYGNRPIYTFDGTLPVLDEEEGYVYKRKSGSNRAFSSSLADALGIELVDLGTFKGLGVQQISMVSETDPTYSITINFEERSIGINRDWGIDAAVYANKGDRAPTEVDGPTMIRIANTFLDKHGIDVSSYGEPEIVFNNYTIMSAMLETDPTLAHPEGGWPIHSVTVRYPLEIDGLRVVGQSGESVGVSVNINTAQHTIESVWGLESQQYERSQYPLVQDTDTILEMVRNGGYTNRYYGSPEYPESDQSAEQTEVPVEKPEMVLMQYWKHSSKTREQFLVPALRFDIDEQSAQKQDLYVQDAIVIPLVEDIIAHAYDQPMPMPMERMPTEPTIGDGAGEPAGLPEREILEI